MIYRSKRIRLTEFEKQVILLTKEKLKVTDPIQEVEISFEKDNFSSRRTTGHNLFDPDSLITGEEEARGLTYANSSRKFPDAETRERVIRGEVSQEDVVKLYPRTLNV